MYSVFLFHYLFVSFDINILYTFLNFNTLYILSTLLTFKSYLILFTHIHTHTHTHTQMIFADINSNNNNIVNSGFTI